MITKEQLKQRIQNQSKIRELTSSNKNLPMPSTRQMIRNVGGSIVRNVQSVAHGNALNISEADKEKRLNICKSCEFYDAGQERCSKCGCYLKVKTYLKAERCPVGKW
jgi:hypothetical protein